MGGCATVPDIAVSYYFPRAQTQFVVTQTIGCSPKESGKHRSIRSVISVAPSTTHSADLLWIVDGKPRQGHFSYTSLRAKFNDADAIVELRADGRLSSINTTSAGAGAAILKDLVTIAGTTIGVVGTLATADLTSPPTDEDAACDVVDDFAIVQATTAADPRTTPLVTLTYAVAVLYDIPDAGVPALLVDQALTPGYEKLVGKQTSIRFVPDAISKPVHDSLYAILGERKVTKLILRSDANNLRYLDAISPSTGFAGTVLELNRVAMVNLAVTGHVADLAKESQLWTGVIPVPTHTLYQVPVPAQPFFGHTAFGISISEYGSITTLHYGSNTGAHEALDAVGTIAKALQPKTATERASELQGQADLIAQQQRLIQCQLSPKDCK